VCALAPAFHASTRGAAEPAMAPDLGFPLLDLHVHLDNSSLEQVLPLSQERGVKFGIVEHAGTRENQYPVVLSNDAELEAYLAQLEGKPVFKGVQAEWTDWMGCFASGTLARLDYVLTDAMTLPGKSNQRVKLWEPGALGRVGLEDAEAFMDRYVAWHVQILERQPVDILANTTWLPEPFLSHYDRLWTPARMSQVIAAAVQHKVALEISASYRLPRRPFLELAKAAGAKFSFGSNGRYPNMGKLDYAVQMARTLGLGPQHVFVPASDGQKAVQRRRPA